MVYPPPVTKNERKILEIICRGHPDRIMEIKKSGVAKSSPALEWTEIQIAAGLSFDEFGDCIAHLTAGRLINSGIEGPGFFGRLTGKLEKSYFWATDLGVRFLIENSEEETPDEIELPSLRNLTADDIQEAVRAYENSFDPTPFSTIEKISWANEVLDDDIKKEIEAAAREKQQMWTQFENLFGFRGAVKSDEQKLVRDPVVKRTAILVFRAEDEQLARLGFPPSEKPKAWDTHYESGNIDLPPPSWS